MNARWLALAALGLIVVGGSSCGPESQAERSAAAGTADAKARRVVPATASQILAAVRERAAPATVVNVWATWCAPCREEFPEILRLSTRYRERGLDLVLVSTDFEVRTAQRFLADQAVSEPSFLKEGNDMEFIDTMNPRWSGALPATFVFDRRGTLRFFREGKTTYEELEREVLEVLESDPSTGTPKEPS